MDPANGTDSTEVSGIGSTGVDARRSSQGRAFGTLAPKHRSSSSSHLGHLNTHLNTDLSEETDDCSSVATGDTLQANKSKQVVEVSTEIFDERDAVVGRVNIQIEIVASIFNALKKHYQSEHKSKQEIYSTDKATASPLSAPPSMASPFVRRMSTISSVYNRLVTDGEKKSRAASRMTVLPSFNKIFTKEGYNENCIIKAQADSYAHLLKVSTWQLQELEDFYRKAKLPIQQRFSG